MSTGREVRRILWAILALNWSVAAAKLLYGRYSGSLAIAADGLHSFADGASNIVALIASTLASQPPDEDHPYGHRKFEVLGSLAIGVMILLGVLEVGRKVFSPAPPPIVGAGGFAVVLGTLAVNIGVAVYESRAGRHLRSPLLTADARHTSSDVLATLAVLAAFVNQMAGGPASADRAAAVFIIALIGITAIDIFRTATHVLVDRAPLHRAAIVKETLAVAGVVDCHKVRSRGLPGEVLVDLHIQVDPAISVAEGHRIAHGVQRALRQGFPGVVEVSVHTEPASERQMQELGLRPADPGAVAEPAPGG